MRRFLLTLWVMVFLATPAVAQDKVFGFEKDDLPILNEELRKVDDNLDTLGTDLDTAESDIDALQGYSGRIQQVSVEDGAYAASLNSELILLDDNIPANTAGKEFMTLAITPTSATSELTVDVVFVFSAGGAATVTTALFRDATVNALKVAPQYTTAADQMETVSFSKTVASGSTSATTFKVRAGCDATDFTYFNGTSAGRRFGGVTASSITITEHND